MQNVTSDSSSEPLSLQEISQLFHGLLSHQRIALGVSGGADSLALLYTAVQWACSVEGGPDLFVFTVNHGLRTEAAEEASGVAKLCAEWGVSHRVLHWFGEKPCSNIQAKARDARHKLLRDAAKEAGCSALLLAHHLEDQAETFLYRLARGSGVYGLAGMKTERNVDGLIIARPFLGVRKARLTATLQGADVVWFEDPSNDDENFDRVRFRRLLPSLRDYGLDERRLSETARQMARASDALEQWVERFWGEHCELHAAGPVRVDLAAFRKLPEEVGLRLLGRVTQLISGADYTPRLEQLERLWELLRNSPEQVRGSTLSHVRVLVRDSWIFFHKEAGRNGCEALTIKPGDEGIWDGRFQYQLVAGGVGCTIRALGEGGFAHHGIEPPENWPKSVFLTAPIIVFSGGVPYIPWITACRDEEQRRVTLLSSDFSLALVRRQI